MTFIELAQKRYSVRKFSDKPVEEEKLERVLQAGRLAPTAKNIQPQRIYVAKSPQALEKLNKCSPCIFGAPVALVVCYDESVSWVRSRDNKNYGEVDAAIVATHMILQAQELGLGTVLVGVFDAEELRRAFNLPDNLVPSLVIPLGYAAADAAPAPMHEQRKPLSETVIYV
jgi:nitroreductase